MRPILEVLLSWFADEGALGDLLEEFRRERVAKRGRVRAEFWYAREVVSVVWHRISWPVALSSALAGACAGWLCLMEMVLRHPGYTLRATEDLLVLAEAALAAVAVATRTSHWLRFAAVVAITYVCFLSISAVLQKLSARHFEGFVVLAAGLFLTQSVIALLGLRSSGATA